MTMEVGIQKYNASGSEVAAFSTKSFCLCSRPLEKWSGTQATRACTTEAAKRYGEGEGEVAFFSAKRWDRRNRTDLIESPTPCHDAHVVGPFRNSNPLRLTAMSEDYTTAPQHLQSSYNQVLSSTRHALEPLASLCSSSSSGYTKVSLC